MSQSGASIEAILRLNTTPFTESLETTRKAVNTFKNSMLKLGKNSVEVNSGLQTMQRSLSSLLPYLEKFYRLTREVEAFNKFANGLQKMAESVQMLSNVTKTSQVGMIRIKEIMNAWSESARGLTVNLRTVGSAESSVESSTKRLAMSFESAKKDMADLWKGVNLYSRDLFKLSEAEQQERYVTAMLQKEWGLSGNRLAEVRAKLLQMEGAIIKFNQSTLLTSADLERMAVAEKQLSQSTTQTTSSLQRQSSAFNQTTSSANRMTTATNRTTTATNHLKNAMNSLRMIGTMVASMMVWNFASSLVNATRETVNAKSEMEGYFKMLHFNQTEISQFNKALDETVTKFQRINKYALGETISSIGVEFNLSTKEMEKAMPVVSMITSEYLRAGRNVNEASLAVKDILQGEFQRLSRETGVKGDQLKEAGWSGDKKDVMGLLDALDKVGKSRNWDVFVTKANSLNDAVLILQNRFSEWTADMVNVVQPSILFVFNSLMTVGGLFGQAMSGIWKWLHDDGFVNQAVRWTGIATAITGVVTALISYRTGANLVQIAQMGLRGSIIATILGLKAEEVATYGTRNAIVSKLTSIKAEQVATIGVRNAILSKVLGVKAETVATMGLKNALAEEVIGRRIQEATMKGATAQQKMMIYTEFEEQMAKRGTLATILAKVGGVNMETFAQKGLIVALAERIAQSPIYIGSLEAEEIAELSTAEAGMILAGTLAPLIAIFIGLAVAVYSVVKPLQDASEQMKSFNNIVNDGENIIKQHKKAVDSYTKSQQSLTEEQSKYTQGSKEYLRIEDKLKRNKKDLETATNNYKNSIKAVEMANSRQAKFEEEATKIAIHNQTELADAFIKTGISSQEAYELASTELEDAKAGAEQLRKALQMIKYEADRGSKKTTGIIDMLSKDGIDKEKIKEYGTNLAKANEHIRKGMERFMTSDDLMDRIGGWIEIQQGRLEEWWTELNAFFEVRDWDGIRDKLIEGFNYLFYWTPIGQTIDNFGKQIEEKGFVGMIMDALFGEGDTDGTLDIVGQFLNDAVFTPIGEWVAWFMQDPSAHLGDIAYDLQSALVHFLFGEDATVEDTQEVIRQWMKDTFVTPIQDAINDFLNNPLGWFDNTQGGIGGFSALWKLMFGDDATISGVLSEKVSWLVGEIGRLLSEGIMNIPIIGTFLRLFALLNGENTGANSKGKGLGDNFKDALLIVLNNIPVVGTILKLLSLIDPTYATANSKGKGVGDNVNKGYFAGVGDLVSKAIQEFTDIANGIAGKVGEAFSSAQAFGQSLWNGLNSVMKRASPGFFHDQVLAEFGTDIPTAISDSSATAYTVAQGYAQQMYAGMNSVQRDFTLGGIVDDYQDDAQIVADYSQLMGMETTTAFNDMSLAVNNTTSQMQGNVVTSYSAMQSKQSTLLNQMKSSNTSAYNEMYTKSNQSLLQMRDSTSNVTAQMIQAWDHMKNSIIASARQISSDATVHFNQLSNTIGSFYRKIQNPSMWGSGSVSVPSRSPTGTSRRVGRAVFGHGAGASGGSTYTGTRTMSVQSLKRKLCPNGDCGTLFDGYQNGDIIDVLEFLASVEGEHGFGGWDFASPHFQYIKTRTNEWNMKSPVINLAGGIPTDTNFKVKEFANGSTPKIGFDKFQSIAGAIFSRIPYKHYYDSSWKGSWLGALQAGACNCSDGADALIALARTFGFSGYKQWGTWSGEGHFWAVINGVPMDTTAWQGGYGWTSPKVSGYGARNLHSSDTNEKVSLNGDLNITINTNGNDIEVENISEESARQILEIMGVSLATGR